MLEALGPRQFFPQDTYNDSYRYSLNMAADYPTTIPINNHDAGRRDDGIGPSRHSIVGASGSIDPQLPCHVGISRSVPACRLCEPRIFSLEFIWEARKPSCPSSISPSNGNGGTASIYPQDTIAVVCPSTSRLVSSALRPRPAVLC